MYYVYYYLLIITINACIVNKYKLCYTLKTQPYIPNLMDFIINKVSLGNYAYLLLHKGPIL